MHLIDLHVHSTHSDGVHSVAEMIDAALEKGIAGIAFAEHFEPRHYGALRAYEEAQRYISQQRLDMQAYPAVEVNIKTPFRKKPKIIHAVFYPDNLEQFLKDLTSDENNTSLDTTYAALAHPPDYLFWENHAERVFPASEFKTCFRRVSMNTKSLFSVLSSGLQVYANSDAHSIDALGKGTYVQELHDKVSNLQICGYNIQGEFISFDENYKIDIIKQWINNS
jgi:hypothetical protein